MATILALGGMGMVLLFLEMFLPGLIAGIAGAILLIVAVWRTYSEMGVAAGHLALGIALAGSGALWWWWCARFQHSRFGRQMILSKSSEGVASGDFQTAIAGAVGSAITDLRPSGMVIVNGRRLDALTDGDWIEAGAAIVVLRSQAASVVVQRADPQSDSASPAP